MNKRILRAGGIFCALFAALLFVCADVSTVQAQEDDALVAAASGILYANEGSYTSVNPNDNGAVSVGKLQWHGWRALALVKTIVRADDAGAQELLGDELYQEVITYNTIHWKNRVMTADEAAALRALLATEQSKAAQDALAFEDISDYLAHGRRLGIINEAALVYFADIENQGGAVASQRVAAAAGALAGGCGNVTLNELHEAAMCDTVMGNREYNSRRFKTYKYAAGLGYPYCSADDSYIPTDYVSAKADGAKWVQRALNTCMKAGLRVTGTYDEATKEAVCLFQEAQSLEVDGYAGRDTIAALIRAVCAGETVTPPQDKPDNEQPDKPLQKPGLKASKTGYAVNDTQGGFTLDVTSANKEAPVTYKAADTSVLTVDEAGAVKIKTAGKTQIVVAQAQTQTYAAAQLAIQVTVYSTDPADYEEPSGALYAEKTTMKKEHIQWLQAALTALNGADIKVNGVWSDELTAQVVKFQQKCALEADGIAGELTQQTVKELLLVKKNRPQIRVKSSAAANRVSWNACAGVSKVYIYRRSKGGSYERVGAVKKQSVTSWRDTKAKKGKTYAYAVRFCRVQGSLRADSRLSEKAMGKRA